MGGTARGLPCTREGSHLLHDLREFRAELVEGPLLLEVLAALAPIVRAAVVLLTPFPAVVVGPQSPRRRHAPRGPPPRDAQCPRARRSGHRLPPSLPPRPPPQRTHPHAAHADGALRTARSLSLSLRAQIRSAQSDPEIFFAAFPTLQSPSSKFRHHPPQKQNQIWRSSQKRSSLRLTSEHRDRGGESRRGVDDRCWVPCRRRCPAVAMRGPKCPLPPHVRPLVEQELDLRQQQLVRYLRGGGHPQPCRP